MNRIYFKMGEVFPAEDPLATWILSLSIIANDLLFCSKCYLDVPKEPKEETAPLRVYYFRLTCAHFREAVKFLDLPLDPEVKKFTSELPDDVKKVYKHVKAAYSPWKGSFVERIVKPLRDEIFHYPDYKGKELKGTLKNLAETESFYLAAEKIGESRSVFADEVLAWMIFGEKINDKCFMTKILNELLGYLNSLVLFSKQIELIYFKSVKKQKPECFCVNPKQKNA